MRDLTSAEKDAIWQTIKPLVNKKEIVALCVYGSRVAGYATLESDYDIILVLKPFSQRVKYYYLSGQAECSALVVDPRSFQNDCAKSSLGEFVSGRLLNAYFPVYGEDILSENETLYKRRVILDALSEAYAEHLEFASEINFPLSYFLFEKLRKRAVIYPPVVYSYAKTYGEQLIESNLDSTLVGFRRAALLLQEEGIVEYDEKNDALRVPIAKFHGGLSARIEAVASFTTRSLTQYAVHGYAGRVRPNVVGREVLSKISRSRKAGKLPKAILRPKESWGLSYGKLFVSSDDWLSDLIDYFGMDADTCKITQKSLGEFYNSAGFYTLEDARAKKLTIAVKRFKDIKGMKWGVLNLWSLKNANFTTNATERLYREYSASKELKKFGLHTPDVLAVFLDQRMMVTKYVFGKDLSKLESEYLDERSDDLSPFSRFGRELAILHNSNYCMGDTKPSNMILSDSDSEIYFADLEQSQRDGNKTWDVAEFIYYSVRFTLKEARARKMINSFVLAYLEKAQEPKVLEQSIALRYRAPFQAFIAPNVMNALRRDLAR